MLRSDELKQERAEVVQKMEAIDKRAKGRALSDTEQTEWNTLQGDIERYNTEIDTEVQREVFRKTQAEKNFREGKGTAINEPSYRGNLDKRYTHEQFDNYLLGKAVRAFVAGREQRGLLTAGASALIQDPAIMQQVFYSLEANNPLTPLGAQFMDAKNYGSWAVPTTPPTISWHTENSAITPDTALTIGAKAIDFANAVCLVKISRYVLEDNAINAEKVVQEEILRAIRRESLRVVFAGASGNHEPVGLDNISGVQTIDGSSIADYDEIINAYGLVMGEDAPLENVGWVSSVNMWSQIAKWKDGDDNPLQYPTALLPSKGGFYTSTISETYSTSKTRIYVGDFSQLLIGYSGPMTFALAERYADELNFALLVWFRMDVQAIRPACFVRIEDIPTVSLT